MQPAADYRTQASACLESELLGTMDEETPTVTIDAVRDATDPSGTSVLRVEVMARIQHQATERVFTFDFPAWESYLDRSPAAMAAGLAVLIRSDIREEIASAFRG